MNQDMFVALMHTITFLGMKDVMTKEETLAYGQFLDYAGSVARYNRLIVEEEILRKLDEEYPNDANVNKGSKERVA